MTTTEIVAVNVAALVPTKVFAPGGVDAIISKLEVEARAEAEKLDISTAAGRKAVASLAYKVARSKTALDDMGKKLVEGIKAQAATIDADRRIVRDRLDKLRDEVRKPLDDFEEAEERRIAAHEAALAAIPEAPGYGLTQTSAELSGRLDALRNYPARDWQEFAKRAADTLAAEIARTESLLAAALDREEREAELARLRQEEAERAARAEADRIEREKKEAAERAAAQARADAEAEAQRKADAEAARVAEEQRRRDAEAQAERDRIEADRQRAERERAEAQERADQAERDRVAAEQRAEEERAQAERDRIAAAERAESEKQAAVLRERQRAEDARRAEEAAAAAREADRAHKGRINRAAMDALVSAGLSEGAARTAIEAIARKQVPAVKIEY